MTLRRIRIAELRDLEEYCWERHNASVGQHIITTERIGGQNGDTTSTVTEELNGDRGYLELALKCKSEIIDLEGSRPPRKTALTNPDGTKPYDAFGDSEELKRLNSLFTELSKQPR